MLSSPPDSSGQKYASDEGELQCGKAGCGEEFAVEFVELAKRDVEHAIEIVAGVDVAGRVHAVQKRSVSIHRAQRRRQENEEQAPALRRSQHVHFTNDESRALFRRIELRLE